MGAATLTVKEVAELSGVSEWGLYESIRRGDCPFLFLKVGRRIVFPRRPCFELLGLDSDRESSA